MWGTTKRLASQILNNFPASLLSGWRAVASARRSPNCARRLDGKMSARRKAAWQDACLTKPPFCLFSEVQTKKVRKVPPGLPSSVSTARLPARLRSRWLCSGAGRWRGARWRAGGGRGKERGDELWWSEVTDCTVGSGAQGWGGSSGWAAGAGTCAGRARCGEGRRERNRHEFQPGMRGRRGGLAERSVDCSTRGRSRRGEPRRQPLAPDCGVLALGRTRGLPRRSEARLWVEGHGCHPAMPGTLAGARREIFPSCRQDLVILCGPLESFVSPSK